MLIPTSSYISKLITFEDPGQLIILKWHFSRALSSIQTLRSNNFENNSFFELRNGSSELIQKCAPENDILGDQKLVLLLKVAVLGKDLFIDLLTKAMMPYVKQTIDSENEIEEFASILK